MRVYKETPDQSARTEALESWLSQQIPLLPEVMSASQFHMDLVSGDASFRRYFRAKIEAEENPVSYIAVDAPPEHENSRQFCKVAALLLQSQCLVPEVLAYDFEQGFMLLSDLGDRQLLSELNQNNVEHYYSLAFEQVIKMQKAALEKIDLPLYSHDLLMVEMGLFQEWFLSTFLELDITNKTLKLVESTQNFIAQQVSQQPQVFVHRDFHSRNLMIVNDELAMIDFQDAVVGPISYDAVSLLKDCYIQWSETQRKHWLAQYYKRLLDENIIPPELEFSVFYQDFELMGLQRHLKVLGIFARLSLRDGKHDYLKDLPLTFSYVEEALYNFEALSEFRDWFVNVVKPVFLEKMKSL